jgi:ComF family protein
VESLFVCPNCHGRVFHFECAIAVMPSRGTIRELIHGLKYRNMTWAAQPLADFGVLGFRDPRMPRSPDFLVPVPLHPLRRRERGYNQAELLARAIGQRMEIPVLDILRRVRNTTTQTHFDRKERMKNLSRAFKISSDQSIKESQILLVDDVLTTGSTLDECAKVLLAAGAGSVYALAIGRG